VLKILKPQPKLSKLIEYKQIYPSRNRIMHQVKSVQHVGNVMYISLDCGMQVIVKDSSRGRAARWLNQMIYWAECKHCHFPEKPSKKVTPKEKLKIAIEKKYKRRELRLGPLR
jgi:pyrrolysyl-tRNA synthetase-like protein